MDGELIRPIAPGGSDVRRWSPHGGACLNMVAQAMPQDEGTIWNAINTLQLVVYLLLWTCAF